MKLLNSKLLGGSAIALTLLCYSTFSHAEMSKRQKKLHAQSIAQGGAGLYDNAKLSAYVSLIGNKALAHSPHADRDYYFYVLDTEQVEAFTPGSGLIYISRGLLALIRSEGQLFSW